MRMLPAAILVVVLCSPDASAQVSDRLYTGLSLGSNFVTADPIDASRVGAVGAVVGIRLRPSISVQFEVEQGFGKLSRVYEGIGTSFAGPNATREEIERLGVYQRFEHYWNPRVGWSGLVVWRDAQPRRIGVALFGGVTATRYRERLRITTLRVPAGVDPDSRAIQPSSLDVHQMRGGLTGGLMVPITLAGRVVLAPEVRYIYGSFGDEIYKVFGSGVRVLWRF